MELPTTHLYADERKDAFMVTAEGLESTATLEDRLVSSTTATLEMYSIHIGRALGLYKALTGTPRTPPGLASAAGINPRYAREWLEQQAVAGFLTVDDAAQLPDKRIYRLDDHAADIFTGEEHPAHVSPLADILVGIGQTLDKVTHAYRTGEGVAFADYGPHMMQGQGAINRPVFTHDLVPAWIDAIDGLLDHLNSGARIADIGCGVGWASIAMARQIPGASVIGWDLDPASIAAARQNAAQAGVEVRFELANAGSMQREAPFALITILEALHDMSNPVQVLRAAGGVLAEGGVVLVADERVADEFAAPGDELERMMYGWSITHCLPAAMSEHPSAAIGTVIRAAIIRDLANAAGFSHIEKLDVDAGFFQLHALRKEAGAAAV